MTTPDDGDKFIPEGNSHDGEMELTIPPWLIWSVVGVGVGVAVWLAYDVYTQNRKQKQVQDSVVALTLSVEDATQSFVDTANPSVNGRAKVESDEDADKVL